MIRIIKILNLKILLGSLALAPYYVASQSVEYKKNNTIFGITLGESTLEDISKIDNFKHGSQLGEMLLSYKVENNGKSAYVRDSNEVRGSLFSIGS